MFSEFTTYWWLLLMFIPLFWGIQMFLTQKKKEGELFFIQNNQSQQIPQYFWHIKTFLLFLGLFLLLLAVWRPQWGETLQKVEKKGLDIVFAIDVSKSMQALDFSQGRQHVSRLDATKYLVESFIAQQKSSRIGLVEFAGESFIASPLTLDHTVFLNFLKSISSDDLGKQGTNLGEALHTSLNRLEIQSMEAERGKAIVLFSDGDETISHEGKKMAQLAKEKGIKIFTVGIGSEKGSPIPEGQDAFGNPLYKKWKGEVVFTALNPKPLQEIARTTEGEYFHTENINDLKPLSQKLQSLPQKIMTKEDIIPHTQQYFWFASFGIFFFVLGSILPLSFFRKISQIPL
jgi:Ca-activated chloride channel family protein